MSPEYNASMPGALKNAIDWLSRSTPQPFNDRQCILLSASPSMAGGNRGLWSLRVPLEHLGSRVYPDMFSLARAHQAFDEDGNLTNRELHARLDQTIIAFMDLVEATGDLLRERSTIAVVPDAVEDPEGDLAVIGPIVARPPHPAGWVTGGCSV